MESSQPSFKLKHLRLTLSKYDAKYSKTSTIPDDDTSNETDLGTNELHPPPRKPCAFQDKKSSSIVKTLAEACLNPVGIMQVQGQKSDETLSTQSTPLFSKDHSKLDSVNTLASVETDSEIGFDNVHSVSSLNESILPLEDEANLKSAELASKRKFQTLPSFMTEIPLPFSKESLAEERIDVSLSVLEKNPSLPAACETDPNAIIKIGAGTLHISTSPTNKNELRQINSEKSSLSHHSDTMSYQKSSLSISEGPSFKSSRKKTGALKMMNESTKFETSNAKVSVAIQTSSFEDVVTNGLTSVPSENTAVPVPIIKPLPLPIYVRENYGTSSNSSRHNNNKGGKGTMEREIETLVSYHLDLVTEFLERQHRLYIANCKAVQLLERGYKENTLDTTFKVKKKRWPRK